MQSTVPFDSLNLRFEIVLNHLALVEDGYEDGCLENEDAVEIDVAPDSNDEDDSITSDNSEKFS